MENIFVVCACFAFIYRLLTKKPLEKEILDNALFSRYKSDASEL